MRDGVADVLALRVHGWLIAAIFASGLGSDQLRGNRSYESQNTLHRGSSHSAPQIDAY